MNNKKWLAVYFTALLVGLSLVIGVIAYVDPYFHYHKPIDSLFYTLNNERSQNDGIIKYFDYEAIITGTSMTENFKASEAEDTFGYDFIKVPFSGGSFKEINDNIRIGLEHNPNIKMVIRSLDTYNICRDKDYMRYDLIDYPTYLYDNNIFNDIKYVANKEILIDFVLPKLEDRRAGAPGGITSFDDYANWMMTYQFCAESALQGRTQFSEPEEQIHLTDDEIKMIKDNIKSNVTDLANKYPDVQFNYFLPPYSIVYWGELWSDGDLERYIQIQQVAIEEILNNSGNIHLFSFDNMTDITENLDNYKDEFHYGEWINSRMLTYMKEGVGLLTKENYQQYLKEIYHHYSNYDYPSLVKQ